MKKKTVAVVASLLFAMVGCSLFTSKSVINDVEINKEVEIHGYIMEYTGEVQEVTLDKIISNIGSIPFEKLVDNSKLCFTVMESENACMNIKYDSKYEYPYVKVKDAGIYTLVLKDSSYLEKGIIINVVQQE